MRAAADARAALQLSATSESSLLEQTTAAVAVLTGARFAYLAALRTPAADSIEVMAAAGAGAPAIGYTGRLDPPADAFILPLRLEEKELGRIVAAGLPETHRDFTGSTDLPLLACVAALALRNVQLARELAGSAAASTERGFRLTNGVAHYLKNVLGAATDYVELLDLESPLTPRQQDFARASRRNIASALRLVSELQDLGRVDTGRVRLESQSMDVGAALRGMVRDWQLLDGKVKLDIRIQPRLPRIRSDVDTVRRIVDTLVSNALRYSGGHTPVELLVEERAGRRAGDPGRWVCVSVTDHGPGVREREHVFEAVARAEAVASMPGFRLPICRRLARLLGGDLTLATEDGSGASFTLWLPANGREPAGS